MKKTAQSWMRLLFGIMTAFILSVVLPMGKQVVSADPGNNLYTITVHSGEGYFDNDPSVKTKEINCFEGANLSLNASLSNLNTCFTDNGKVLVGFYEDEALTKQVKNPSSYSTNRNVDLYTKWEDGYKVIFDYGEAAEQYASSTQYVYTLKNRNLVYYPYLYGKTYGEYAFDGWYADAARTQKISNLYSFLITGNTTIYAKWTEGVSLVYHAGDNGKFSDGSNTFTVKVAAKDHYLNPRMTCYNNTPGKALVGWALTEGGNPVVDNTISLEDVANTKTSIDLYAVYEDGCAVTFNLNGGNSLSNLEYRGSAEIQEYVNHAGVEPVTLNFPKNQILEEYKFLYARGITVTSNPGSYFAGWSTTADAKDIIDLNKANLTDNTLTLYAIWNTPCTATFDTNGGYFINDNSQVWSTQFGKGSRITATYGIPERDGDFVFSSWNTAKDGRGTSYNHFNIFDYIMTGDVTFYAQWKSAYTVTLDVNGGSFTDSHYGPITYSEKVAQGSSLYVPGVRHSEKAFLGWSTDKAGKNIVISKSKRNYIPTSSITLYAAWGEGVKVTYHSNNDNAYFDFNGTSETEAVKLVAKGDKFEYIEPELVNDDKSKQFCGFNTKADGSGTYVDSDYVITTDIDVYAVWEDYIKTVFDANGGYYLAGGTKTNTKDVYAEAGDRILLSTFSNYIPRHDQKAFIGWSTTPGGKIITDTDYIVKKEATFYAVWGDGIKLTLDGNGGLVSTAEIYSDDDPETDSIMIGKGARIYQYPIGAHRIGYRFEGWSKDKNGKADESINNISPTKEMTLYAVWTKEWDVEFNANGGTFTYDDSYIISYADGDKITSFPVPSLDGRAVEGWYFNPECTGPELTLNTVIDKNMTVYAKWSDDYWKVELNAGIGFMDDPFEDEETNSYTVNVAKGKTVSLPVSSMYAYSDTPYAFMGWYEDQQFTKPIYIVGKDWQTDSVEYTPKGDMIVYAKFAKKYKITLDGNGGLVSYFREKTADMYVTPGQSLDGQYFGYLDETNPYDYSLFKGWYKEKECKTLVSTMAGLETYVPTGDITLYAGYKENTVKVNGVSLTKKKYTVGIGDSFVLSPVVTPGNAANKKVSYSSSDEGIATVDETGKVTGVKNGTATVTITTVDGGYTVSCEITVDGKNAQEIAKDIDQAKSQIGNAVSEDAAKDLVNNVLSELGGADKLADKVEANSSIAEKLEELEDAYVQKANVDVVPASGYDNANALEEAFGENVNVNDISASGLGLNAEPGKAVKLDIEATPENEKQNIDENKFKNAIQVNIEAKTGDSAATANEAIQNLVAPITITLPMPTTIPTSKLYVLHFYADGTFELIKPKLVGNKMVITVSHFSTFAIVELANGTALNEDNDNKDNTDPGEAKVEPQAGDTQVNPAVTPASGSAAVGTTASDKTGKYKVSGDFEVAFTGVVSKKAKSIKISDTIVIDGQTYKVTSIANGAFKNCKKLTKVTIGKNVTKIGSKAFANCKNLKTITIKSTEIKSIGKNAFKGIKNGATIKVPKSKKKDYTKLLKKAKLPKGVKIK